MLAALVACSVVGHLALGWGVSGRWGAARVQQGTIGDVRASVKGDLSFKD